MIMAAALPLFVRHGLAATSIDQIRVASGASVGSIYHHFGGKEGIAAALYTSAICGYQQEVQVTLESAASAEEGIRAVVRHFLTWVEQHRDLAVLMLSVEHGDVRDLATNDVAELNQEFGRFVALWLQSNVDSGSLPDLPSDLWMPAVLGAARRFAELWIAGQASTSIREAAQLLGDLVWASMSVAATSARREP